jgi:hypothetical protein
MALTNSVVGPFGDRSQIDMELHLILRPLSSTLSEGKVGILLLLVMGPHNFRYQIVGNIASRYKLFRAIFSNFMGLCRLLVI